MLLFVMGHIKNCIWSHSWYSREGGCWIYSPYITLQCIACKHWTFPFSILSIWKFFKYLCSINKNKKPTKRRWRSSSIVSNNRVELRLTIGKSWKKQRRRIFKSKRKKGTRNAGSKKRCLCWRRRNVLKTKFYWNRKNYQAAKYQTYASETKNNTINCAENRKNKLPVQIKSLHK